MKLRCRVCGFIRNKFHGWAFTGHKCSGKREGWESMLHDWEVIDV